MNLLHHIVNHYRRSTLGAVAVAFGLALPVLLCSTGVAVDASRGWLVKQRLSSALDASALAAASSSSDEEEIQSMVEDFMAANYPDDRIGLLVDVDATFDDEENLVTVTAQADVETMFMQLFGFNTLDVTAEVEVKRANRTNIELAMVLDVSGSMSGDRIDDLMEAAGDMVDIIVSDDQDTVYSKIAIAPYSMGVNVGSYATSVRGSISSGTCTSPGCNNYRFTNANGDSRTLPISTCVSERTGANAYTDVAPTTAATRVGRNYVASNNPCPTSTIMPLTSDKDALHEHIEDLNIGGSTAGHIGLAWGWYLVAPAWGYLWADDESEPAAYNTENLVKVVVMMTDGDFNTPYCNGVIARNALTGSGSAADHINCNATNGASYSQAASLCTAMKQADRNIVIYTIGFDVAESAAAVNFMNTCATDSSHVYMAADGDDLKRAFRNIAGDILSVYVSK